MASWNLPRFGIFYAFLIKMLLQLFPCIPALIYVSLLKASHHTLWSCSYQGNVSLKVVSTKVIVGVVAMILLSGVRDKYFVVEKPGLDIAHMRGDDETIVDEH